MASQARRVSHGDHPAVQTLLGFFTAMNQWERAVIARKFERMSDLKTRGKKLLDRLEAIYREFCEPGAQPERLTEMNWGPDQPDYNPATERIVSVKPGRAAVVVETYMTWEELKMRYELVKKGDRWYLRDHRKCYDPDVRKWCYCQL